jgi:hypothetical protein
VVKYSPNAARALAFLKRHYNDVDIFIEDMTCHNMALFVFRNILGPSIKLRSVNQLGGRTEIIKACALDQANDGRKKLYIIDGDLDLLTGAPKPRLKHLYRLRAYCFENLVISDKAVLELASESDSNTPPYILATKIDHPKWISTTTNALLSLFVLYAVARKLCPSLITIGFNVHQMCDHKRGGPILSGAKVRARMRALFREMLSSKTLLVLRAARRQVAVNAQQYSRADCLVSGKDYLCPLLRAHLKLKANFRGNVEDLKVRLARHYDPRNEEFLARRLRAIAGV